MHPGENKTKTATRVGTERESDLEHLVRRLALLGATEEEISAVRDHWDDTTDGWSAEIAHNFAGISDGRLMRALKAIRDEYPYEPPSEPTQPEDDHGNPEGVAMGLYPGALPAGSTETAEDSSQGSSNGADGTDQGSGQQSPAEGESEPGSQTAGITAELDGPEWTFDIDATVPELLALVGDDKTRASVVLQAELATGQPRKTLVEQLQRLVSG